MIRNVRIIMALLFCFLATSPASADPSPSNAGNGNASSWDRGDEDIVKPNALDSGSFSNEPRACACRPVEPDPDGLKPEPRFLPTDQDQPGKPSS
jgi:hypothetical protein